MVRDRHCQELLDLSSAACDNRLDEESFARLEALLSDNDEACALWLTYMQLDADLRVLVATSSAERRALARLSATGGLPLPVDPPSDVPTSHGLQFLIGGLVVVTVSLLVTISAVFWGLSRQGNFEKSAKLLPVFVKRPAQDAPISLVRPPQEVASLFSVTKDAVWSDGEDYQVGQLLAEGTRMNLLAGSAEISMTCGADVLLQSPCTAVLLDGGLVQLEEGKLTAQVAKWATGFVVEVPGLQVTDLGTRFAVSAESPDAAEAHVLDGSVLAKPLRPGLASAAPLLLHSGEAIRFNIEQGRVDRMAAERERFVDKFGNVRPYRLIELPNTGRGLMVGDEDPRWRVTRGPRSLRPWPRPAVVCAPHRCYSDNEPERSQWISVEGGIRRGVPRNKIYTFETTFDLTGFDPTTVSVVAQLLADNGITGIRLNGKPVPMQPWVENIRGQKFQIFHVVEIRDGFVEGENRIEIGVFNGINAVHTKFPNSMALRVEWRAFGCSVEGAGSTPVSGESPEESNLNTQA